MNDRKDRSDYIMIRWIFWMKIKKGWWKMGFEEKAKDWIRDVHKGLLLLVLLRWKIKYSVE